MTWGPFPAYPVFASSAQAVSQPVDGLDAPLAAGDGGEVRRTGLVRVQAGHGVDNFLADQGASDVVAVAADPRDPGDLREVQVADPDERSLRLYSVRAHLNVCDSPI
jgi:hypothetical protein